MKTPLLMEQAEELEDLLRLGSNLVDTLQSNDKVDLWLGGDVELARVLCRPSEPDLLALLLLVLVHVLLGTLEDHLALGLVGSLALLGGRELGLTGGRDILAPLEDGLRCRRHGES